MKICDRCYTEVAVDAEFCTECGAPVNGGTADAADAAVYPQLAKANLLRMRGDYEEAEKDCLAVLKQFPYNSTAHILLGDIHLDKGDSSVALDWYELAADLEPTNPSLAAKRDRLRGAREKTVSKQTLAGLEVPPSGARTAVMYGGIAVIVIGIAIGAFFMGQARADGGDVNVDDLIRPISIGEEAPPDPRVALPGDDPEPAATTTAPPASQSTAPQAMTAEEIRIMRDAAARLGTLGPRLIHIDFDPRTSSSRATVTASGDADFIDAARVAVAVFQASPQTSRVHLRVIDTSAGFAKLIATVSQESLSEASRHEEGSAEWATALLTNVSQR